MFREFQSTTFERYFNQISSVKQIVSESIIAEKSTKPLVTFFTMECGEGTCRHTLTVKCIKKIKCADTCGDLIQLNS